MHLSLLVRAAAALAFAAAFAGPAAAATFTNPIIPVDGTGSTADPSVVFHDGFYYWARALNGNSIAITKGKRLQDLGTAPQVVVYTAPAGTAWSSELWAPELKYINGQWFLYFAADDGNNVNHRMYGLYANSENPQGSWTFHGKVAAPTDSWAIDGTVLDAPDGSLYFIWSGWQGVNDGFPQRLYIAQMSDPMTISSDRVEISEPTLDWETQTAAIQEGPETLVHNGQVQVVYSASASWTDNYKLGLLTNTDGNYMNPGSWVKNPQPIFVSAPGNHAYGPGHNTFTTSPDGTQDWIIYHATDNSGTGWGSRDIRAQPFTWNADGTPNLGTPAALGVPMNEPSGTPDDGWLRFLSSDIADNYIRHQNGRVRLDGDAVINPLQDGQWRQVPGLSDPHQVSFESVNFPGSYLRHRNGEAWLDVDDGSQLFHDDATFVKEAGQFDDNGVSFESHNYPGRFLRHRSGLFYVETLGSDLDRMDATFYEQ